VGHACVTTGSRGFSMPSILSSRPSESEHPVEEINLILLFL